jgi:Ca2+-binding EF-hand superfamily protein
LSDFLLTILAIQQSQDAVGGTSSVRSETVGAQEPRAEEEAAGRDERREKYMQQVRRRFAVFDLFDTGSIEFGAFRLVLGSLLERDPSLGSSISHSMVVSSSNSESEGAADAGAVGTSRSPGKQQQQQSILSSSMDAELMRDVFSYMDADCDGKVSIEDFHQFYRDVLGWKYSAS